MTIRCTRESQHSDRVEYVYAYVDHLVPNLEDFVSAFDDHEGCLRVVFVQPCGEAMRNLIMKHAKKAWQLQNEHDVVAVV